LERAGDPCPIIHALLIEKSRQFQEANMFSLLQAATLLGVCFTGMHQPLTALAQEKRAAFEIYRAETKSAPGLTEITEAGSNRKIYLHKSADLTRADIEEAKSGKDSSGMAVVEITFTKEGAKKMARLTKEHLEKPMAVLVDGKLICAPSIRAVISEKAVLQGENADEVAKIVKEINKR
jgi:preprotein translocase subunit SecD